MAGLLNRLMKLLEGALRASCRIFSDDVDKNVEKWTRFVQFAAYQLGHEGPNLKFRERLDQLVDHFRSSSGYISVFEGAARDLYHLPRVFKEHRGSPLAVAMVFRSMASRFQIPMEFVRSPRMRLLKFVDENGNLYVDLGGRPRILDAQGLLEIAHDIKNSALQSGAFERLPDTEVLAEMLGYLRESLQIETNLDHLLKTVDLLLELQPKNFSLFRDRASIYRKQGQTDLADRDLKRFQTFAPHEFN